MSKSFDIVCNQTVLWRSNFLKMLIVARRGARLADERSPSGAMADGARRSVAVPNGEGVASGSATQVLKKICSINIKKF
ncbi:MAG: hypothetical protein IJ590_01960, partial [Rickettsiales bacterium]|nr:hypothetical protein [Rickettsiales bacterium]